MKASRSTGNSSQRRISTTTMKSRLLGLIILATFAASIAASSALPAFAQSSGQAEFQLAVIQMAAKLPADGGKYPVWIQLQTVRDSNPIQAPYDISIRLSTSDDSVLVAQHGVLIRKGESIVAATIETTKKAGMAEVTAVAEGAKFGKSAISTIALDSLEPSILSIEAGSGKFIPSPSVPGKIYIQLLNSAGMPAITKKELTVYLSSSDSSIGSLPAFVKIPAGSSGVLTDFIPTFEHGSIILTASASGFAPSEVEVEVVGPVGSKLVIEMAPASMPAEKGFYSFFTVQVRDSSDTPVKMNKAITVILTSSDPKIVDVSSQITIPSGSSYAVGRMYSKGTPGSAVVSASAQGLVSGPVSVNTISNNWADPSAPKKINVFVIPSVIAPDSKENANVIVQVTDTSGKWYSYKNYYYNGIKLYSYDPSVQITSGFLTSEATFAVATAASSSEGKATIAASYTGYSPGSATLNSKGLLPVALELAQFHNVVLADSTPTNSVIISFVDKDGNPAFAQKNVIVALSSSNQDVATVEPSEYIAAGQSYTLVEVRPTFKAGTTTITASAQGLAASSIDVMTVGTTGDSSPYQLGIKTIPKPLADGRTYEAVFVQLQNVAGNPVPANSDVRVILSSSNLNVASVQDNISIKTGSSFGIAQLTPTATPGKFTISASSTGYSTVSTQLETFAQPMTIVRTSDLPRSAPFESIPLGVDVFAAGQPLVDAVVQVGGEGADTRQSVTDENGHAESLYVPTEPGKKQIVVTVNKPGYKLTTVTYPITIEQTVDVYVEAKTEGGKSIAVQAKISGNKISKTINVKAGTPSGLDDAKWGTYRIGMPDEFTSAEAKYSFVSWSDGVTANPRTEEVINDEGFTAIYSAEYLLTATTETGTITGIGYYPEGENAVISISPTSISGFPTDKSFVGWSGDVRIASASAEILMDGPKTIKAEWSTSYLKLIAILGAAGGGGFVAYFKFIKPKKIAKEKARAPDLDWYKT